MTFGNGFVFDNERGFVRGGFRTENGRFTEVLEGEGFIYDVDLGGKKIIPGLLDVHTHGNSGFESTDGTEESIEVMARFLASKGVTAFCPTTGTAPYEKLEKAYRTIAAVKECAPEGCARIAGINMEGPFFSYAKRGAQSPEYLKDPDVAAFKKLYAASGGNIRLADCAPELKGAVEFAEQISKLCRVSAAHSDASYDEAAAFFAAGARHVTHLFNGLPVLHHRKPGVIGAAAEREDVTAELICDGLHVHPSAVRAAFRLFPGRICLISDALRCCGQPDGTYESCEQPVYLQGKLARLADGTIAGSASTLADCLKNAVAFGIPEDVAIRSATSVPAEAIGVGKDVGFIAPGRYADFLVCEDDLSVSEVYMNGKKLGG